jgi:flagellin
MSTVINTNLASLFAQNSLSNAQNNLATSVQRLSSGLRINSAKDDAAGLAISQNMQSQINGTNQSVRNLSDATNLLQTADTSLSSIHDMLLRLKQLSTQGYDGSLSTSQKLDIVQEMKDLNNEINATAQRTQFNGINLLTSGASVDLVNSDLKTGNTVSNTAIAPMYTVSTNLGYYDALNGSAATKTLGDSAYTGTTASTFTLSLDPAKLQSTPGSYTLTSNGSNLTMAGTINGQTASQTINLADVAGNVVNGVTQTTTQPINFSNFGVAITVNQTIDAGKTETGAQLASSIITKAGGTATVTGSTVAGSLVIGGKSGTISDVRLSGTAPGTYTLSYTKDAGALYSLDTTGMADKLSAPAALANHAYTGVTITDGTHTATATVTTGTTTSDIASITITSGGSGFAGDASLSIAANWDAGTASAISGIKVGSLTNKTTNNALTLTGTINGVATTQSVNITDNAANSTETIQFSSFGVAFDVKSFQSQNADQIGSKVSAMNSNSNGVAGQIVVSQGANSALKFQSGPASDSFIQIDTLNVQTGSSGSTAGTSNEMITLGSRVSQAGAGNLGALGSNDSLDTWQTAFKNAAAAVDNAIEYISTKRATFGSQMNRLSYVSTNLQAQSTNLQNSRSAIMDTNFAAETANLTKGQIMQQAATAMLAQANQMPNVILSLLK